MGRGEGGGFMMGSTCIPEIFKKLKKEKKKKKIPNNFTHAGGICQNKRGEESFSQSRQEGKRHRAQEEALF